MKPELEQKLYEKYPEIFTQKDWDMTKTCMCWGICCGDGWYTLIDQACTRWETLKRLCPGLKVELVQVKEKFGTLRLYHGVEVDGPESEAVADLCDLVEKSALDASTSTCEQCGGRGKVRTMRRVKTLCDSCEESILKDS